MTVAAVEDGARLDVELVRRGLARSRQRAARLVADGRVQVAGRPARKSAQLVRPDDRLEVRVDGPEYVSRAAHKLLGALDDVERLAPGALVVEAARCLDAGASTGGFTQVLLERGARHVVAVDVGHDQLDPAVGRDERVTAVEGQNVRDLDSAADALGLPVDVVVGDLSFISLTLVAAPLVRAVRAGGDLLLLVKPQFEVGRERLPSGGVVVDPAAHAQAVVAVARACADAGGRVRAVLPSVLPGESGNRELFLWVHRPDTATGPVPAGPQGAVHGGVRRAVQHAVRHDEATLVDDRRQDQV